MKKQADKHRSERSFNVGDWVFLKLQPYVQSSVAARSNNKLSLKFFGPFRVLKRVGAVAYLLILPVTATVHPVFHVSLLKSSPGSQTVSSSLPSDLVAFQVPERFLQWRWTPGDHPVHQVLVKWSHMPASLSTWEAVEELRRQFPRAPAWGHAGSQEGGNVSTGSVPASSDRDDPAGGSVRGSSCPPPRPKR